MHVVSSCFVVRFLHKFTSMLILMEGKSQACFLVSWTTFVNIIELFKLCWIVANPPSPFILPFLVLVLAIIYVGICKNVIVYVWDNGKVVYLHCIQYSVDNFSICERAICGIADFLSSSLQCLRYGLPSLWT